MSPSFLKIKDIVSHRYLVCWFYSLERLNVSSIRCLQWLLLFWQMNTMFPEKHVQEIVPMRDGIRLLKICFKLWVAMLRLLDGKYGNPLELALTRFTSDKCIICFFRRGTENTEDFKTLSLYKIVEIIFSVLHGEFLIFGLFTIWCVCSVSGFASAVIDINAQLDALWNEWKVLVVTNYALLTVFVA